MEENLDAFRGDSRLFKDLRMKTRKEMRAEITDLQRTLSMEKSYTIEEWEASLPQALRDRLAARALIAAEGDAYRAASRLGFKGWFAPQDGRGHVAQYQGADFKPLLERIFKTPGCQAILERDLEKPDEMRAALIARQIQVALYGDDRNSTMAFTALAHVCGWRKTPDIFVQQNRQTILALVTQKNSRGEIPAETVEALPTFLEHEPGAAVRIDSDSELVDKAIEEEE